MWWRRRTWGRKRRARLCTATALFSTASSSSSFYCLKERRSKLKHFPNKQAPESVITEAFLYGWLWLWSASLWECGALPHSVRTPPEGGGGLWQSRAYSSLHSPTPTVAIRSVKVRRLKMRRGDWFCRFAANGLYVMSPEPDELAPLHRWARLICHGESGGVWGGDASLSWVRLNSNVNPLQTIHDTVASVVRFVTKNKYKCK